MDCGSEVRERERVEEPEREGVEGVEGIRVAVAVEALVWRVWVAVMELELDVDVEGREKDGRGGAAVHW